MFALRIFLFFIASITIIQATPLWARTSSNVIPKLSQSRLLEDYLLPKDLVPISYDITLVPYFDTGDDKQFTFDGQAIINVIPIKPTKLIRMHANDMTIMSIMVKDIGGTSLAITSNSTAQAGDDKHFFDILMAKSLTIGEKIVITVEYIGNLNNDLEGFYRSSYKDEDGSIKWMGVTQFESTGARRAFPCFDEPEWKATFTLHIAHDPKHTVLSNMPEETTPLIIPAITIPPNWVTTNFKKSVLMSSYLVAFSVSEFTSIVNTNSMFKDWARPNLVAYAKESNDMAPIVINHMKTFTGIEYALPKMDQIAIPDFAAGAMENWGLVTYRESAMLYIPGVSTSSSFMGVKSIVAHELAHQWFGDLVSPKWWSSIWLNEGFATYFSYDVLATAYPEWDQRNIFVQGEMHYAFQKDGLESTHPLLVYADTPASTGVVFDTIAYSKGASIIHMMRNFLGDDSFKAGIQQYLNDRSYNSADKDDLWNGLRPHVIAETLPEGQDIKTVMDTWVVQSGYPVVTVKRNYDAKKVSMTQERFLTLRTGETNEVWWIPLTMTSQNQPNFENTRAQAWHNGDELTLDITAGKSEWLIVNVKQAGFYRVNYDSSNWALISKAKSNRAEMEKIAEINRAQIMDDALALARAALLDYDTALDTTDYLNLETKYTPWNAALSALNYIYDRLAYEKSSREIFEKYVLMKQEHMYELVGGFNISDADDMLMKRLQSLVLSWHCKLNDKGCNSQAGEMFDLWQQVPATNSINPDFKSIVYCSGMRLGGSTDYDFLFAKYEENEDRAAEQSLILSALGCATDTALLEKYLAESIAEDSKIRQQDARSVLSSVYNNYLGVDIALDFLLDNYDRLNEVYNGLGTMQGAFTGISVKLNTQEQRNKLEKFRDDNSATLEPSMVEAINQALKNVDETLTWQQQHRGAVVGYLKKKTNGGSVAQISVVLMVIMSALYLIF